MIPCQVWVGTSGYSYPEWIKAGFYPPGTRAGQMLTRYAQLFSVTELNHTWYQMPQPELVDRQRLAAPSSFLFATKLTRTMTHEVDEARWPEEVATYRRGIVPLVESRQLVAVLVQLPNRFHRSPTNRTYLARLLDELGDLPVAVEFRNASWLNDRVFAELERRRVTLVTVDGPRLPGLFPSLDAVTHPDLVYARFHGRNTQGWYSGSKNQQFDYDYRQDELAEWVETRLERMARRARRAFVFFNTHVAAQAPRDAEILEGLLRRQGFQVVSPRGGGGRGQRTR